MNNYGLWHSGVLGMKWGVRRTPTQLGHRLNAKKPGATVKKPGSAVKKAKPESKITEPAKRTVNDMSNAELKERVARLALMKQYNDLSPKQISRGQKFTNFMMKNVVNDIVLPSAKEVGKAYLTKQLTSAINKAAAKKSN